MRAIDDGTRCPCLSGWSYAECCGPAHRGERRPPTAEALMRSRYAAFWRGDEDYLLRTWHPRTRPATLSLEADLQWRRLDIVDTVQGGPWEKTGRVHFRAVYRDADGIGELREDSTFERVDGAWFYVDGTHPSDEAVRMDRARETPPTR